MSAAKIGFIGLGRMGKSMAANLRKRQHALTVYDIRPEPIAELEQIGAKPAISAAEVIRQSDLVLTMVPTGKEVQELVFGADGMLATGRPGSVLMDMSTIDPFET